MSPSQSIMTEANKTFSIVDSKDRRFVVRHLTALDSLRLFKAAGPVLAQNEPWLSMAGLVFAVLEFDGIPVPPPVNESQIENLIEKFEESGLSAIALALAAENNASEALAVLGNLLGTQS